METLKIVAFSILAAISYGILHDQVTAHVCVEYFTIAHPPIFPTQSPFLLAIGWGIIATWWVGLPLGILLALAARVGRKAKLGLGQLWKPITLLMAWSAGVALFSGVVGALSVAMRMMELPGDWPSVIPVQRWSAFAFALWAHAASYIMGILGGLFLIASIIRRRLNV